MSGHIKFISAGAGSGKTFRLSEVLQQELKNGVNPAGVIATTFTRKAAAELRERVRGHLLKGNETRLANAIGQARIGTVNSVCGELLQRFAFEAGLPPVLQVLEESQSALLYHQSIEAAMSDDRIETIQQLATRMGIEKWSDHVKTIANLVRTNGIDPAALSGFATENADALLALFPAPVDIGLEAMVLPELDRLIPIAAAAAEATPTQKNLQDWLSELETFRQKLQQQSLIWPDWAKIAKAPPPARLRDDSAPLLSLVGRFETIPALQQDIRDYIDGVFKIAGLALSGFEERKRSLGKIDFIDQERKLLDILDLAEVKEALTGEIELLLVDEFQDTSPIQLALFAKLARVARRTYWVGDTKQAIYGFRGSDSRLMDAILADLEDQGNTPDTLEFSWRSRPQLVSFGNAIFTAAFADTLKPERITLQAKRQELSPDPAVQSWALRSNNKAEAAQAMAAGIKALIAANYKIPDKDSHQLRSITYADIAILARKNDSVVAVAQALTAAGIPTETNQPGLCAKPEIVLAMACLRRLSDETDTLATAEIVSLTSGDAPEVWLQNRLDFVAGRDLKEWSRWLESGPEANPIIQRLSVLRTQCQVLTVKEALELVIAECNIEARVLSWSPGHAKARMRLANLQALISLAEKYEESCRGSGRVASIAGFVLWMQEQAKAKEDSLAEAGTDSVRVLTYHACKGLEWPVTVCTELDSNILDNIWGASAQPLGRVDVADPLKDRFVRFWPWPYGRQKKVDLAERANQSPDAEKFRKEATEEAKRLLYVAFTRPRDLLILASPMGKRGNLSSGEWIESLNCPQLLAQGDVKEITFASGTSIPCICREYAPDDTTAVSPAAGTGPGLYWFAGQPGGERLPLIANPSSAAPVACQVAEIATIGKPLSASTGPNPGQIGLAVHGCIAAAVSDRRNLTPSLAAAMMQANDVTGSMQPDDLVEQISAFFAWCENRYGKVRMLAEHPVEMVMENGQWVVGQIDLLIDTPEGWILIDHKASTKSEASFPDLAAAYSGQLAAYQQAVEAATRRNVIENWLYLPVAGKAVKVGIHGRQA